MAEINPPVAPTMQAREATTKISQKVSDATSEAVSGAADAAGQVARQSGEAIQSATRSAATMVTATVDAAAATATRTANVATEAAFDAKASAIPLMDIYRDAARHSADHMQALFGTWMTVSRGMHDLQLKWLETVTHSMESTGGKPFEVWQAQRDLYVNAIDTALASTSRMLETASQSVKTAIQPPETRY